jgi:iron complex outermembrane receptor protein
VSDRTRFPTIFERFSSRFGGATSNPGLKAERGMNYEIGFSDALGPNGRVSGAVFYNDVTNVIQSIPMMFAGEYVTQSRNVGKGEFYGVEASIDYAVNSDLIVGGNITIMKRDISNPSDPNFELTGVPNVKGIAYLTYRMTDSFSLTPSLEFASSRWTSASPPPLPATPFYYKTGAFALANLQGEYSFTPGTSLMLTARNLFDRNYTLTDGYPEAGRSFQATVRTKF